MKQYCAAMSHGSLVSQKHSVSTTHIHIIYRCTNTIPVVESHIVNYRSEVLSESSHCLGLLLSLMSPIIPFACTSKPTVPSVNLAPQVYAFKHYCWHSPAVSISVCGKLQGARGGQTLTTLKTFLNGHCTVLCEALQMVC